jgi:hypothetical protein
MIGSGDVAVARAWSDVSCHGTFSPSLLHFHLEIFDQYANYGLYSAEGGGKKSEMCILCVYVCEIRLRSAICQLCTKVAKYQSLSFCTLRVSSFFVSCHQPCSHPNENEEKNEERKKQDEIETKTTRTTPMPHSPQVIHYL